MAKNVFPEPEDAMFDVCFKPWLLVSGFVCIPQTFCRDFKRLRVDTYPDKLHFRPMTYEIAQFHDEYSSEIYDGVRKFNNN